MCTPVFTAELSTIGNIWEQPKYPSVDKWMEKMCVCMRVYIAVYIYMYMCIYMYIHTHTYICPYRGAECAAAHRVIKSQTQLSDKTTIHTHTHTQRILLSHKKKNEIFPLVTAQVNLEGITLNEISHSEKDRYYMI